MWWFTISLAISFFVLFLLQLLFIHKKYLSLKGNLKTLNSKKENESTPAKFDIYGVNLDLNYRPPNSLVDSLKNVLDEYETTLPYTCDFKTTPERVKFNKVAIVAMHPSPGAHHLKQDIIDQNVKYIIINNVGFMALHHPGIESLFDNMSQHIFVTLVALPNHVALTDVNRCSFQMLPLFGSFKKMMGTGFLIDLSREVFSETTFGLSNIMIHLFAYGLNL
jgi:hypothetical protein